MIESETTEPVAWRYAYNGKWFLVDSRAFPLQFGIDPAPLFTADALATARAEGKAEGMQEAAGKVEAALNLNGERERAWQMMLACKFEAPTELHIDELLSGLRAAILAAIPAPVPEQREWETGELVRHKKRGTEYEVIGIGKMQTDNWEEREYAGSDEPVPGASVDMREVVIYRSATDPTEIWVRPREEFEDGRFERLRASDGEGLVETDAMAWFNACWKISGTGMSKRVFLDKYKSHLGVSEDVAARMRAALASMEAEMIRVCPKRDAKCPHGMGCPYTIDRFNCEDEPNEGTPVVAVEAFEQGTMAAADMIFAWLQANGHNAAALAAFAAWEAGTIAERPDQPARPAPAMTSDVARQHGYTGDSCSNCGSMRMRIAGHCMVCEQCGTTTGCS